jgi:hypothetical protein
MTKPPSFAECIAWGKAHPERKIVQDADWLQRLCDWRGMTLDELDQPVDLAVYLAEIAPKFHKNNVRLLRDLDGAYDQETYKQYQRGGGRLIRKFTGAWDSAVERRVRTDAWAELVGLLKDLATAGLVSEKSIAGLATLIDCCRSLAIEPQALSAHHAEDLKDVLPAHKPWDLIPRGLRLLDTLRCHKILGEYLPVEAIGQIDVRYRREFVLPPGLAERIDGWVAVAARVQPGSSCMAEPGDPLKPCTYDRYRAAFRNYAYTAGETGLIDLDDVDDLSDLFEDELVAETFARWLDLEGKPGGLSARSMHDYTVDLALLLERNGHADAAANFRARSADHRTLKQGRQDGRRMSAKTRAWCCALLADEGKATTFETQHILYWRRGREALAEAADLGIDLRAVADPKLMRRLPKATRKAAKRLLRRARMFGICAAFAAIELEGAPFRKSNTLDLTTKGKPTTFFTPAKAEEPSYTIIIPNELLKNGDALTARGEELPPITIEELCSADHGVRILTWFFDEIRPLFPAWQRTSHLFLAPRAADGRIPTGTFDRWLLECSNEIGLPLTPHNFRHGYVSLQYNDDRSSLPELAILLGDAESTLRRHYAFIDRMRTARDLQESVRQRRAKRLEAWKPVSLRMAA